MCIFDIPMYQSQATKCLEVRTISIKTIPLGSIAFMQDRFLSNSVLPISTVFNKIHHPQYRPQFSSPHILEHIPPFIKINKMKLNVLSHDTTNPQHSGITGSSVVLREVGATI